MNRYQRSELLNMHPGLSDIVEKYHTPKKLFFDEYSRNAFDYIIDVLKNRRFDDTMEYILSRQYRRYHIRGFLRSPIRQLFHKYTCPILAGTYPEYKIQKETIPIKFLLSAI